MSDEFDDFQYEQPRESEIRRRGRPEDPFEEQGAFVDAYSASDPI